MAFGLFIIIVIWYDIGKKRKSERLYEYAFLIFAGILGGLYGMLNDAFTVTLSPEYFVFGKGVAKDKWIFVQGIGIGGQAGFSGGVIFGAILLFARTHWFASVKLQRIASQIWIPFACGVFMSILLPFFFGNIDILKIRDRLPQVITQEQADRFLFVWWEHAGVYTGIFMGTIVLIAKNIKHAALPVSCGKTKH